MLTVQDRIGTKLLISWEFSHVPPTLADLVGQVQRKLPGHDFGCMRLFSDRNPPAPLLHLLDAPYLPGDIDEVMETFPRITPRLVVWYLNHLPRRFSSVLGAVRRSMPGIGFDAINLRCNTFDYEIRFEQMY